MVNITEIVRFHFFVPDTATETFNAHVLAWSPLSASATPPRFGNRRLRRLIDEHSGLFQFLDERRLELAIREFHHGIGDRRELLTSGCEHSSGNLDIRATNQKRGFDRHAAALVEPVPDLARDISGDSFRTKVPEGVKHLFGCHVAARSSEDGFLADLEQGARTVGLSIRETRDRRFCQRRGG